MATKTKTYKTIDQLASTAQQAGLLLMTAAATIGMLEMPDRATKVVIPNQPSFAFAGENQLNDEQNSNPLRREKEEVEEHYISYSVAQRTPGRHGKH